MKRPAADGEPQQSDSCVPARGVDLRKALRHDLDVAIGPVWLTSEGQDVLSKVELEAVYRRRVDHMRGFEKMKVLTAKLAEEVTSTEPDNAFAFWANDDDSPDMTLAAYTGLSTLVRHCQGTVLLLRYHYIEAPAGVVQIDAGRYLDKKDYDRLRALSVEISRLADYIRVCAVLEYGGWIVDCDAVWIRQLPGSELRPTTFGYFLGSMRAAPGRIKDPQRYWRIHYLRTPGDRLY